MADTRIEWATKVWNPVTGCTKISPGCKNCYMFREYPRLARMGVKGYAGGRPDQVRLQPDRLDEPLHWRKPQRIFVNSMSDLFHNQVSEEFIGEVFIRMALANWHIFQILTKRPARMLKCLMKNWTIHGHPANPLPNVWLGVSVEDQKTADERIPLLLQTPAAVRFVSEEPSLGQIWRVPFLKEGLIHQWIWGGESGPDARPPVPEWARAARDQAVAAGVSFFFKQWGEWSPIGNASRHEYRDVPCGDGTHHRMFRIGKKTAGLLLDGRAWNEYPPSRS